MRVAVFASHDGTTLQALIDLRSEHPGLELVLVVSNNSGSGARRRADEAGIRSAHLSSVTHPEPDGLDRAICELLQAHDVELVVLAGYMKRIGPRTLKAFDGRILNTHPSLLPKFGGKGMFGLHVHRAVLEAGEKVTGASVHVVTEEYDQGPVIAQREVDVDPSDTPESLALKVQAVEKQLLAETVAAVASGSVTLPT